MENHTPRWPDTRDVADLIRRSRLTVVDAQEVRLTSILCRHRAAVLCKDAERLRAKSLQQQR